MEMVRLNDMEDFEELTLSKWNIKQPDINDDRENALDSGICSSNSTILLDIKYKNTASMKIDNN